MSGTRRMWMLPLLTVAGFFAAPSASVVRAGDNLDALLEQVPADAWGFAVIPSLSKLNEGINAVQTAIMGAPMMDAMSMLQLQMGIEKGLDKKAGVIIFSMDQKKYENKGVGVVVTTTDAKDFLANFSAAEEETPKGDDAKDKGEGDTDKPDAKAEKPEKAEKGDSAEKAVPKADADGIMAIEIQGETAYARASGKFVILTPSKEVAKAIAGSKKSKAGTLSGARKQLFAERTVSISVAAGRVVGVYQDDISNMSKMMLAAMGPQGASMGSSIEEMITVARQLDSLDLCIDFGKDGLHLTGMMTPKTGTELEESMKSAPTASGSLLKGLPGPNYILAFGAKNSGNAKSKHKDIEKAIDSLMGNPKAKESVDAEKLKKLAADAESLHGLIGDVALSVSALADGPSGLMAVNVVIDSTDSAKLLDGLGKIIAAAMQLPTKEEDRKKIGDVIVHKAAAETSGATKVDHLCFDLSKAGDDAEEAAGVMKKLFGADGMTFRMGAVDGKHLVLCLGGGKDQFAIAAKAAASGDTSLAGDAGIAKAGGMLPKGRRMEMYFSADNTLKLVKKIARAMEEDDPLPSEIKPIGAAVSMATSIDGATGRFDFVLPMEVVTGIKNAFMEGRTSARKAKMDKADKDEDHKNGKNKKDADGDEDDDKDDEKDNDKPHE